MTAIRLPDGQVVLGGEVPSGPDDNLRPEDLGPRDRRWRREVLFETLHVDGRDPETGELRLVWRSRRGWVREPWAATKDRGRYQLHHVPSGCCVPAGELRTLRAVRELVAGLEALPVDWTAEAPDLGRLAEDDLCRLRELLPLRRVAPAGVEYGSDGTATDLHVGPRTGKRGG